jgi:hypothetical protein
MRGPPIPQRIPPLAWRRPAFVWTPLALALAIGWPAGLFWDDLGPQRFAIVSLFIVFALALITLGASWLMGRAPRSRSIVVLHVVVAGAVAAIAGPLVLTWLLRAVAEGQGAGDRLSLAMSFALTPLVVLIGLPVVLISGIVFAWVALRRRPPDATHESGTYRHDVQPFR